MWIWQKAYPLCLHSTKGTVFTCLLPFVPVCYTNKQEFYIKVYDGTWRTLSTPFFILNNLCWTRYRWLTNVVLWIIWMKKMKYRSENVSTHSRYTLETYFWAVIWLCLWQKIPPPTKLSYHNYWCPWSSAVAGRADDVYSGCTLSYDVQIVPYVTELSLPHSYVCLLCCCVRWNNLTNNGSILTFLIGSVGILMQ